MKRSVIFKFLLIFSILYTYNIGVSAQEADKKKSREFWHRVSVGGNLGFQFGTVTGIYVSPEIKFRVVDQLHFGVGFNYQYMKWKEYYYDYSQGHFVDLTSNVFGGRIFARYYLGSLFSNEILGNIFGHIEYEYLTYNLPYEPSGPPPDGYIQDWRGYWYRPGKETFEINSIFVGGGYKQVLGGKAFMDIMILFNLNETYDSPYSNPIVRIGFGASF